MKMKALFCLLLTAALAFSSCAAPTVQETPVEDYVYVEPQNSSTTGESDSIESVAVPHCVFEEKCIEYLTAENLSDFGEGDDERFYAWLFDQDLTPDFACEDPLYPGYQAYWQQFQFTVSEEITPIDQPGRNEDGTITLIEEDGRPYIVENANGVYIEEDDVLKYIRKHFGEEKYRLVVLGWELEVHNLSARLIRRDIAENALGDPIWIIIFSGWKDCVEDAVFDKARELAGTTKNESSDEIGPDGSVIRAEKKGFGLEVYTNLEGILSARYSESDLEKVLAHHPPKGWSERWEVTLYSATEDALKVLMQVLIDAYTWWDISYDPELYCSLTQGEKYFLAEKGLDEIPDEETKLEMFEWMKAGTRPGLMQIIGLNDMWSSELMHDYHYTCTSPYAKEFAAYFNIDMTPQK